MTSSKGNIFRGTGLLCEEFIGHRWIHHWVSRTFNIYSCLLHVFSYKACGSVKLMFLHICSSLPVCLHVLCIHVCVHTCMCVRMRVLVHECMVTCVHMNVHVSMYYSKMYEFVYPFKCAICRSCMCVQFILMHSVWFALSFTLNMFVATLGSVVIDAIKNILHLKYSKITYTYETKISLTSF